MNKVLTIYCAAIVLGAIFSLNIIIPTKSFYNNLYGFGYVF